jgi:hypothetical protein
VSAPLLTINEAATNYRQGPVRLRKAIDDGRLRFAECVRKGNRDYYLLDEAVFVDFLEKQPSCLVPTCFEPTLRDDGFCELHAAERETLAALANQQGIDPKALKRAVNLRHVRCLDPTKPRILLLADELDEDLANLPSCKLRDCTSQMLLGSVYCGDHYNLPGRERAESMRRARRARECDYYTGVQAAEKAGLSKAKISQAAKNREFPSEKTPNGELRIPREPFDTWLTRYRRVHLVNRQSRPTRAEQTELEKRIVELWEHDYTEDEIAEKVGYARNTVCAYLERAGIERPNRRRSQRKLSVEERTEQSNRARHLREAGLSNPEIASELAVGRTQVLLYLAPSAGGPVCEHCGDPLDRRAKVPRQPSFGLQRFCSIQCARDEASDAYRDALHDSGLVSPTQAAERMDLSPVHVQHLAASGELYREWVTYPGQLRPGWGTTEEAIEQLERKWARESNGNRARWLDPDQRVAQLESMGKLEPIMREHNLRRLSEAASLERERALRRAKRFDRYRHPRGRPRAALANPVHLRWFSESEHIREEIIAINRDNRQKVNWLIRDRKLTPREACAELGIGERDIEPPSEYYVFQVVAERDWQSHPELRELYPASPRDPNAIDRGLLRSATDTVQHAVKRLQIASTEIRAV